MQKGLAILRGKGYYIDNFHSRGFAPRENLKFKRVEIMNKSKFLKKSLAMLLALMLVLAMIPLSASAATVSADDFNLSTVTGQEAEITRTDDGWNFEFQYTANPAIAVEPANNSITVQYVDNKTGATTAIPAGGIPLEEDDNGDPAPVTLKVTENNETTEYILHWSVLPATGADGISVTSAKIGDYTGTVDLEAQTIEFVVPFGTNYDETDVVVAFAGIDGSADTTAMSTFVVETNTTKGEAGYISVKPQNDEDDIRFTVTAREADALTAITIGEYKGEFELKADGSGKETGTVKFNVPADIAADTNGDLKLPITYEIGSAYTEVSYDVNSVSGGDNNKVIASGDVVNVVDLLSNNVVLKIAGSGTAYREYTLSFVKDAKDTTITEAVATFGSGATAKTYDGTVDGENIEIVVPANTDLTNAFTVTFTGPVATSLAASIAPVTSTGLGTEVGFNDGDSDGVYTATVSISSYTAPIRFRVTSADDSTYGYYTLTITKAEAPQKNPQVTSAKVVLWPGTDNEYTATGSIDQSEDGKITFTVPYRTNDAAVKGAEYAFAKTSQTSWDSTNNPNNFASWTVKDGGKLGVASNDTDDAKVYTIVFDRMDPETGKSISNFSLSEADWEQLKPYNNNKTFDVTVSGTEFKVTLPDTNTPTSLYPDFTLSEGAALYYVRAEKSGTDTDVQADKKVNGATIKAAKVAAYDANGEGTALTHLTDGDIYVIADEKLAYDIDNGILNSKDYDTIKNTYKGNFVEYTLKVTEKDNTEHRLTSLSADDGKVQATLVGNDQSVIDLSVPYSYVKDLNTTANRSGKEFFFDFELDKGATLTLNTAEVYPGGKKDYTAAGGLTTDNAAWAGNPGFMVVMDTNDKVYLAYNSGNTPVSNVKLLVQAENYAAGNTATFTEYTIGKITVRDAETGASLTSAKVNDVQASIGTKVVNATLNYGANLGQVTLDLEADYMATIQVQDASGTALYDANKKYDFSKGGKIIVTSESGKETTEYTLNLTTGDMFSDVAEDQWYYDYVLEAAELGIVKGNPDGTFKPNDKVTRADFALMTVRMLGVDEDGLEFTTTAFTDVNDETYNAAAIQYCAEKGLIGGDGDGKFRPNDSITRQEAAKIIAEALELTETDSDLFTDDNLIHEWAEDYVYQCKAAGIFGGDAGTGNFRPTDAISRAETAKIMVVAYNNK